jgi:hypothetical protein
MEINEAKAIVEKAHGHLSKYSGRHNPFLEGSPEFDLYDEGCIAGLASVGYDDDWNEYQEDVDAYGGTEAEDYIYEYAAECGAIQAQQDM